MVNILWEESLSSNFKLSYSAMVFDYTVDIAIDEEIQCYNGWTYGYSDNYK